MKDYLCRRIPRSINLVILFMPLFFLESNLLNAEYLFEESEIDVSTKKDKDSSFPTNPFEIVEMMRRYNSMNNATNPSDAIDDALKSFDTLEGK